MDVIDIVQLAAACKLQAIEWGGDVHCPHGDSKTAQSAARLTADHGLTVAAYGSYYRAGTTSPENPSFEAVLDSASALGAPLIRIWVGNIGSAEVDASQRQHIVEDCLRCAELAAARNMRLAFEHHGNTLTDSHNSTKQLLQECRHPALSMLWQPPNGASVAASLQTMHTVLPVLTNIHVFHWLKAPGQGIERQPLAEGKANWSQYLQTAQTTGREHCCLLEFVQGNKPEQLHEDAQTLHSWLAELQSATTDQ